MNGADVHSLGNHENIFRTNTWGSVRVTEEQNKHQRNLHGNRASITVDVYIEKNKSKHILNSSTANVLRHSCDH